MAVGHQTKFDYRTLSADPATGERRLYDNTFANSVFPQVNFTTTDTVVAAMHESNGFADDNFNTVRYYYSAARYPQAGPGLFGLWEN